MTGQLACMRHARAPAHYWQCVSPSSSLASLLARAVPTMVDAANQAGCCPTHSPTMKVAETSPPGACICILARPAPGLRATCMELQEHALRPLRTSAPGPSCTATSSRPPALTSDSSCRRHAFHSTQQGRWVQACQRHHGRPMGGWGTGRQMPYHLIPSGRAPAAAMFCTPHRPRPGRPSPPTS